VPGPDAQFWKEHSHLSLNDVRHLAPAAAPERHRPSVQRMRALLDDAEASLARGPLSPRTASLTPYGPIRPFPDPLPLPPRLFV